MDEYRETHVEDGEEEYEREVIVGAASPLCGRCGGDHIAAHCPTLIAGSSGIDPDAEGTR